MSIVEVARRAGVSHASVSRVINNNPRVLPETVIAVKAAMAELKYTPPVHRRGPEVGARLTSPKRTVIGLLILGVNQDLATPAFEKLMLGVSEGAARWNAKLAFQNVADPQTLTSAIVDAPFDGLLLHGVFPSADVQEHLKKYPTVWLMANRRRPDWGIR